MSVGKAFKIERTLKPSGAEEVKLVGSTVLGGAHVVVAVSTKRRARRRPVGQGAVRPRRALVPNRRSGWLIICYSATSPAPTGLRTR